MAVWFVSRHQGAIDWMRAQGMHIDHWVEHLDTSLINKGDDVIGILPIPLAADVCKRGGAYFCLEFSAPSSLRGQELTYQQLLLLDCTLRRYFVTTNNEMYMEKE